LDFLGFRKEGSNPSDTAKEAFIQGFCIFLKEKVLYNRQEVFYSEKV
jgi:hypothetical protein